VALSDSKYEHSTGVILFRLGSRQGNDGRGYTDKSVATLLPAGINPSGSCALAGVRMWSVSIPALFWALRSKP
jgi:hypothetical protein